jgi:hypothetical protein
MSETVTKPMREMTINEWSDELSRLSNVALTVIEALSRETRLSRLAPCLCGHTASAHTMAAKDWEMCEVDDCDCGKYRAKA